MTIYTGSEAFELRNDAKIWVAELVKKDADPEAPVVAGDVFFRLLSTVLVEAASWVLARQAAVTFFKISQDDDRLIVSDTGGHSLIAVKDAILLRAKLAEVEYFRVVDGEVLPANCEGLTWRDWLLRESFRVLEDASAGFREEKGGQRVEYAIVRGGDLVKDVLGPDAERELRLAWHASEHISSERFYELTATCSGDCSRLCLIPTKSLPPCDLEWGHEGEMHANKGDGFYAREHAEVHRARQEHLQRAAEREARRAAESQTNEKSPPVPPPAEAEEEGPGG